MLRLFAPKKYVKNFTYVNVDALKQAGIKLIICDIDNTLVAHDEKHPNEDVHTFVNNVKASGLQMCLISNNHLDRVETFAKDLDLPTYAEARKPLKKTYKKILKDYGIKAHEIASIGDQLLTDVFGGNRMGVYTILTIPLYQKDLIWTKINRTLENFVFILLNIFGYVKKGECDE